MATEYENDFPIPLPEGKTDQERWDRIVAIVDDTILKQTSTDKQLAKLFQETHLTRTALNQISTLASTLITKESELVPGKIDMVNKFVRFEWWRHVQEGNTVAHLPNIYAVKIESIQGESKEEAARRIIDTLSGKYREIYTELPVRVAQNKFMTFAAIVKKFGEDLTSGGVGVITLFTKQTNLYRDNPIQFELRLPSSTTLVNQIIKFETFVKSMSTNELYYLSASGNIEKKPFQGLKKPEEVVPSPAILPTIPVPLSPPPPPPPVTPIQPTTIPTPVVPKPSPVPSPPSVIAIPLPPKVQPVLKEVPIEPTKKLVKPSQIETVPSSKHDYKREFQVPSYSSIPGKDASDKWTNLMGMLDNTLKIPPEAEDYLASLKKSNIDMTNFNRIVNDLLREREKIGVTFTPSRRDETKFEILEFIFRFNEWRKYQDGSDPVDIMPLYGYYPIGTFSTGISTAISRMTTSFGNLPVLVDIGTPIYMTMARIIKEFGVTGITDMTIKDVGHLVRELVSSYLRDPTEIQLKWRENEDKNIENWRREMSKLQYAPNMLYFLQQNGTRGTMPFGGFKWPLSPAETIAIREKQQQVASIQENIRRLETTLEEETTTYETNMKKLGTTISIIEDRNRILLEEIDENIKKNNYIKLASKEEILQFIVNESQPIVQKLNMYQESRIYLVGEQAIVAKGMVSSPEGVKIVLTKDLENLKEIWVKWNRYARETSSYQFRNARLEKENKATDPSQKEKLTFVYKKEITSLLDDIEASIK